MRRDQVEHAIRTACQIIGKPEVIVVGSQSILGTFLEDQLPTDATMSVEIDILPIADDNAETETERLAGLIEGVAGEFSPFEELHGFSIDGVDLSTSALPTGWCSRLVKVQNANTAAPDGKTQYTGWCLGAALGACSRALTLRWCHQDPKRSTCDNSHRKSDCAIGRALRTLLTGGRARPGRGFTCGRWSWGRAKFRESIRADLGAGLASRARALGRDRDWLGRSRRGGPGHDRLGLAGQEPEPGRSRVPGVDDRGSGDEVVQGAVLALYGNAQEP